MQKKLESRRKDNKCLKTFMLYIRVKKITRKWIKDMRNSKHRYYVLDEWVTTEKNYLRDLNIIQEKIKLPIARQEVLTKYEIDYTFSSLDAIISLSKNLLDELMKFQKYWHPNNVKIGPEIIKLHSFFKIYVQYCNRYSKIQTILKSIDKEKINYITRTLPMDIESYMIKPVQRPLKYTLFLQDYRKHMPQSHPDYNNIKEAIKKYYEVNSLNNEGIERQRKKEKAFALSKLYSNLLDQVRQFQNQFEAFNYDNKIKLYLFNDLIMVTKFKENSETDEFLYKLIFLNSSSFVTRTIEGIHFLFKLFICGKNQCITVQFTAVKRLQEAEKLLSKLIRKIYEKQEDKKSLMENRFKKSEIPIKVRVTLVNLKPKKYIDVFTPEFKITIIGVQKRHISTFKDQILYIIKYEIRRGWNLSNYVYINFQKIQQLQSYLKKKYPYIELPNLHPISIPYFGPKQNQSKLIELRMLTIQQFLNFILRDNIIMQQPLYILQTLKIDPDLWYFAVDPNKQKCSCKLCINNDNPITLSQFIAQRINYTLNHRKLKKQSFCIKKYLRNVSELLRCDPKIQYCSTDLALYFLQMKAGRIDYCRIFKPILNQSFEIKIYLHAPQNQSIQIFINKNSTVGECIDQLSRILKVPLLTDFRLMLDSSIPRILDNDENMYSMYLLLEGEVKKPEPKGFISRIKAWGEQLIQTKKSKIFLIKYVYLSPKFEQNSLNNNSLEKFRLIVNQIIYRVHEEKIHLKESAIIEMASLYSYLKFIENHENSIRINKDIVKSIIPVYFSDRFDKLLPQINKTTQKIKLSFQAIDQKNNKNSQEQIKKKIYGDIVKLVKDGTEYYTQFFKLHAINTQQFEGFDLTKDLTVGINYKHFLLFNEPQKKLILRVEIPLFKYFVKQNGIHIFLYEQNQAKILKLDGQMLFIMDQLVRIYQEAYRYFREAMFPQLNKSNK